MKKIKKMVFTILASCMLVSMGGQVSYAQEINSQDFVFDNFGFEDFDVYEGEFDSEFDPLIMESKLSSSGPEDSHQQFILQALNILENDKGSDAVEYYNEYKTEFLAYCDKPDKDEAGYAFAYHFYNPYTKRNYLSKIIPASKTTAMTKFKDHMAKAVENGKTNKEVAIEELGRAMHYLADVNVTHHAANLMAVMTNHTKYEKYISQNNSLFFVETSDAYNKFNDQSFDEYCTSILDECAINAYSYKEVATSKDKADWEKAARPCMKLLQENAASVLYRFVNEISK